MTYRKRMNKFEASEGSLYHVVDIGWNCQVAFSNAKAAAAFYAALTEADGVVYAESFEIDDHGTTDSIEVVSKDRLIERAKLGQSRWMTPSEVRAYFTTRNTVRCDGVPKGDGSMCACWNSEDVPDGAELPDGWESYVVANGGTKHMCPRCQDKDVKVQDVVVRTTGQC